MKLYDLSYSYFFSFFVKFQRGFWGVKIAKLLVAEGKFKLGPHVVWTPGCYTNYFDFFSLFFSLVCRLIHPYRLSNSFLSDIIERYKFRTFRSNPLARVFLMSPLYHIVRLLSCPASLTRLLICSVPRLFILFQRQSKARLNALAVLWPCLFLFVFDFWPGRRRIINLQTHRLAGVARSEAAHEKRTKTSLCA